MKNLKALGTVSATLCAAAIAGCAASPAVPLIPEALRVPKPQVLAFQLHAVGTQVYRCQASKSDPAVFEWAFKEPQANLFSKEGREAGKHYAGPSWEGLDGSKVVGELVARRDSPTAGAIPWLLLKAKSTSGNGTFARVSSIQRLNTVGGNAPAGCPANQSGEELRVPYSADYLFYADA